MGVRLGKKVAGQHCKVKGIVGLFTYRLFCFITATLFTVGIAAADVQNEPTEPVASPSSSIAETAPPPFDVWEYRIEGNTVLSNEVIEKTVYGFLGPGKHLEEVEQARAALEKTYQNAGYLAASVDIPEQGVEHGVVILKVNEGKVDRLKVVGSHYFSPIKMKETVPALAEGKSLHMPTVQHQLAHLAEESADRTVTPVMRAGRTPGTVEVELDVQDHIPLHGSLEMNARNSLNTTRLRLTASLRYDNLWQRYHSASLQYQISPEDPSNVEVWSGTYLMPLEFIDSKLVFYGVGLDSTSAVASAGALNVIGNGHLFGLRLIKSLQGTSSYHHSILLGWDYKNFGQSIQLTGSDTQNTPITYSPFQASYTGTVDYGNHSFTEFSLEGNINFAGMGSNYSEFQNKRHGAKPDYFYATADLKHRQVLPEDFILQMRLNGQVSESPLISNEQIGAGGMLSVRGYHEVEVLGDDGFSGSLEFYGPNMSQYGLEHVDELRWMAFTEGARLWIKNALPGMPKGYDLLSVGTGFRFQLLHHIMSELYWAYPFASTDAVRVGESRIDFRVAYEF